MAGSRKLMACSSVLLLALTLALIFPQGVLADDAAPPSEETPESIPPEEDPPNGDDANAVLTPSDVCASPEVNVDDLNPTGVLEPIVASETDVTVDEMLILEQLPEESSIVVLDEQGQAEPLVTQTAAQTVVTGDPMWCPDGILPGGAGCTGSFESLTDLVDYFAINGQPDQAGTIWIAQDYSSADEPVGTTLVSIDGDAKCSKGVDCDWDDVPLTIQGGWNGLYNSDSLINGITTFTLPFEIVNWDNDITLNDLLINGTNGDGLTVQVKGNIVLNDVSSIGNSGNGAVLDTDVPGNKHTGTVVVNGPSTFSNNGGDGLAIDSKGGITLTQVIAQGNNGDGASLGIHTANNVAEITCSIFKDNEGYGVNTDMTNNQLTLNGVYVGGNSIGPINYSGSPVIVDTNCTGLCCSERFVWDSALGCVPIVCDPGYHSEGSSCVQDVCQTGYEWVAGVGCQPIVCPTGQELVGNACVPIVCDPGYHLEGSICVQDVCQTGNEWVEGVGCRPIICPTGQVLNGNVCEPISCQTGYHLEGNSCIQDVCETGYQWIEGIGCQKIACPPGQLLVGNVCEPIVCQVGYHLVENTCVQDTCQTGYEWQEGKGCQPIVCPTGQHLEGNLCVVNTGPSELPANKGGGGIIPVTGGTQVIQFSCNPPMDDIKFLDHEHIIRIYFENLCGYSAVIDQISEYSPDEVRHVSGLNITLLRGNYTVTKLPQDARILVFYEIPAELAGHQLSLLYWDPLADNGIGKWIELDNAIVNDQLVMTFNSTNNTNVVLPATFVMVDDSVVASSGQGGNWFDELTLWLRKWSMIFSSKEN